MILEIIAILILMGVSYLWGYGKAKKDNFRHWQEIVAQFEEVYKKNA